MLLCCSDILVLRACVDPMYTSLHLLHSIMLTTFFELQLKSLFIYYEFYFRVFKGIGFSFYNYITYFTSFILLLGNSLCCVFFECRRGEYLKNIEVVSDFNDFCCVSYFFEFVIVFKFS